MTHINQRRDTAAVWTAANPVLQLGEVGWERDTLKAKLGDGVTAWNSLDYAIEAPPNLALYALLDSPLFVGDPRAPTPATGDNDTTIATTAFVKAQGYAALASPTLTGDPKAPTPATADNDTSIATTAFVRAVLAASPDLGGNPTAPTPATSDNDTSIATTAFVKAQGVTSTYVPAVAGVGTSGGQFARYSGGANVGDTVRVDIYVPVSAGSSGNITISLPPGMTSYVISAAPAHLVGQAFIEDAGSQFYTSIPVGLLSSTTVIMYTPAGNVWGGTLPFVFAAGDKIMMTVEFIRAS